jgi:hypothetical protein
VSDASGEWARFITLLSQGSTQESLHPNAYGQRALGACLGKLYGHKPGAYRCVDVAGGSPAAMRLSVLK